MAASTAAILVIFRSDGDPEALARKLLATVARVIVVDNTIHGHPASERLGRLSHVKVLANRNRGGVAGAYNLACAELLTNDGALTHVVLIDDDSDVIVLEALLADPTVARLLAADTTAAVAAAYRDRATGLRGKHFRIERWRLRSLPREFGGIEAVSFVINSMSVWRIEALRQIGSFNEALAIDHVDTEYCLRARQAGLSLYVAGHHEFAHSIGARRRYMLFGHVLQSTGHGASRRYLIGRNVAWLARKYGVREPAFAFLCLTLLGHQAMGIVAAEDKRWPKLGALLRGAVMGGVFGRLK